MSIFQKSVRNEYLKNLDETIVAQAYSRFQKNFNIVKIEEIKKLKEEEYQDGFLRDIFVDVFGYTFKPEENYNLAREYKNVSDSKKADGAILKNGNVIAVIELKSTKTKDLNSIKEQAFNYKNEHEGCKYVITSNFQKIRLYVEYSNEFEEFDLFDLSQDDFKTLYLLLNKESVFNDIPSEIKQKTIFREENISKQLYKDYSSFKKRLFENLVKNNPEQDKLTLFKKSQKLIDRFLFILFAEDRGLLPSNSISRIIQRFETLKNEDAYKPIYDIFKQYFGYMNVGREGKNPSDNIPTYNDGLFYEDDLLNKLIIDDNILKDDLKNLSVYDFNTDVDVNILGHIFEHSLSEIEEITAEIEGIEKDKSKSKRKKDGVFYTPKYITQYIVENTIGTLCTEKRKELNIFEIEFDESFLKKDRKLSKQGLELYEKLEEYKKWLLSLKIVDPACGSGAFLNQALNFLISEHQFVIDMETELQQGQGSLFSVETAILENNLYGVDINEESVEIAKLSLWLRTAQKGRKLSILSNNIKCGNSLIDDPEVAGEKAFNWEKEFPEVFANGGFDVVIGNPPYVNINTLPKIIHHYFENKYNEIHTGYNDLMYYFLYNGINILSANGVFGMITSNYFMGNEYAKSLRAFLSKHISSIINFGDYQVFQDASVHTAILFAEKTPKSSMLEYKSLKDTKTLSFSMENSRFEEIPKERAKLLDYWLFSTNDQSAIIEKLLLNSKLLGDISEIEQGSKSGKNDVFTVFKDVAKEYRLESDLLRKNVKNGDINRYEIHDREMYLIYTDNSTEIQKYPNIFNYLKEHEIELSERNEAKNGLYKWWRLDRPRRKAIFDSDEKIVVPYRATNNRFAYDNEKRFNDGGDIRAIVIKDNEMKIKYVLGVLNSKIIDWYFGFIGKPKGDTREYFNEPLSKIPISEAEIEIQNAISELVDNIMKKSNEYRVIENNFLKYVMSKFVSINIYKKLKNWYELEFGDFIKELNKEIKKSGREKLSKMDEMEWMELFEAKKAEVLKLKEAIDQTDKEIDKMVYQLYGLTDEEIKIVEESL